MVILVGNRDTLLSGDVIHYEKEVVEVEVTPDWAKDEDAVKAAQDVIRKKELEAQLESLKTDWNSTTANYEAQKKEYLAKKEALEKELGTY
jgi:molecular chaperone GrpE (heat shock protein)